jgi:hypothetical protein
MCKWIKENYALLVCLVVIGILFWLWFTPIWTTDASMVAQLTAQEFYRAIGKAAALLAILQFGLTTWVKARIEESVKHDYAKKLEDYKNDLKVREQAAKVAELLASIRWQEDPKGDDPERDRKLREAGLAFDRRAWELSLWLPSETYKKLAKCLVEKRDLASMKELLIDVRKLLLRDEAGDLIAGNILHFGKPEEVKA